MAILQDGEFLVGDNACKCSEPTGICACRRSDSPRTDGTHHHRSDSGDEFDLSPARAWLGFEKVGNLMTAAEADRQRRRRTSDWAAKRDYQPMMLETLRAANPELAKDPRAADPQWLATTYSTLSPPGDAFPTSATESKTDMAHDKIEAARQRANRAASLAYLKPDGETTLTAEQLKVRADAAGSEYDKEQRLAEERQRRRAADPLGIEPDLDSPEEAEARRRMNRRAANAWREPLNKDDVEQLRLARLARETDLDPT